VQAVTGADAADETAPSVLHPDPAAELVVVAEELPDVRRAGEPRLAPPLFSRRLVEMERSEHRPRDAVEELVVQASLLPHSCSEAVERPEHAGRSDPQPAVAVGRPAVVVELAPWPERAGLVRAR
jgi:hypothetical protein